MNGTKRFQTQIDGRAATIEDLTPLAFAGFAHFTAMQVRDGRVRGFDLHLARLRTASMALFGAALPDERVRVHLRTAIEQSPAEISLTATMYSRSGEFLPLGVPTDPALHRGDHFDPRERAVRSFRHSRTHRRMPMPYRLCPLFGQKGVRSRALADIKHVGEVSKTHYLQCAVTAGFDDALFIDRQGRISEATIWNIAFWDGEAVIWPLAPRLPGVTMGVLRRRLRDLGVPQREEAIHLDDLPGYCGAAVMNSWTPGVAISRIASVFIPSAEGFIKLLHDAYASEPEADI